ncbi:hypothetical protein RQP46_003835 [Phenoliferia psychrophenolica]
MSTNARPRTPSLSRRPTTPLRRLSASSLRTLSLSHSRSRGATSTEPPLDHLGTIFAELADSLSDLAGNFEQLDRAHATLDGFNEAFGAYLYSLRINAYTVDFDEGPTEAFSDSIIKLLPISFREEQPQRSTTEKVIEILRASPAGFNMDDLKQRAPDVPQHRLNESLTALVRAKIVLKVLARGVTTYRYDPKKYPV